ncbi:hypothetical protein B0H15DRAFT_738112, partial [Mycena belliarum]
PKEWAVKARTFLEDEDRGAEWTQLVTLWWAREESNGFDNPSKPHSTKKRPVQVKAWTQRARRHTPAVPDAIAFGEEWWGWWTDINPAWRKTSIPMKRETGREWDYMDYPGQNGFLNVLACLKWWWDNGGSSERWVEAVEDVIWVLKQMN